MRKVILALTLALSVFIISCSGGQSQYPPPPQSERSKTIPSIPPAVREAHKSVIAITLNIAVTKSIVGSIMGAPITREAGATGFMVMPGIFVSARHLILEDIFELNRIGLRFIIDPLSGIPRSRDGSYEYMFRGTTNVNGVSEDFPLQLVAMANLGEYKDFIIFKASKYPKNLTPVTVGSLSEGGNAYLSGYIPISSEVPLPDGSRLSVLADMIKELFPGQVYEVIKDMPINRFGSKKFYRIVSAIEFGYSGGPVFNDQGQVGAMTVETTRTFVRALSSEDLMDFVKEAERKGLLK